MPRFWQQLAIASNWPVPAAVGVLSFMGVVTIWADPTADVSKQLIFFAISLTGMLLVQGLNYQAIGRLAWPFYAGSLLLVIYTVLPGVPRHGFGSVPNIKGAQAWIDMGPLHLEPAELMKIAFVMVLARYLRFRSNYRTFAGLLPPFALALAPAVLILKQPALGMAMLFVPTLFAMLFIAGAKVRHLLAIIATGLALLPVAYLLGKDVPGYGHVPALVKPYQWMRVKALFNSGSGAMETENFQLERALTAFASGGWTGKGMGHIPVGQHVPEGHNDMIFALIGEQFGFFGSAVLLFAYIVLFAAGVEIAGRTREPFGRLLAIGIVSMMAGQAFLNLAVATRLWPVTGITLPFVSYGGSSLLASFMAVGLLLNVGQNRPLVMAKDSFEYE